MAQPGPFETAFFAWFLPFEQPLGVPREFEKAIARCCGFGGTSQFSRAFHARFGAPPRQYLALVRRQDLDWHETRLMADGFEQDAFLWRQQGLSGSKQSSGPD